MRYLNRLNQVLDALRAVDHSTFTGTEEDMAPWDAVIEMIIVIIKASKSYAEITEGWDEAMLWQFAQESDFDMWLDVADDLDRELAGPTLPHPMQSMSCK